MVAGIDRFCDHALDGRVYPESVSYTHLDVYKRQAHKRLDVFPLVLVLLALYHFSVVAFHQFPVWRSIGDWIMALPLS